MHSKARHQPTASFRTVWIGKRECGGSTPDVAIQADGGRNVEKDKPGGSFQPLRQQPGAIAFDNPSVAGDCRIVKSRKLGRRSGNSIGMWEVVELIEMDELKALSPPYRFRQCGLAAVRRSHDTDAWP